MGPFFQRTAKPSYNLPFNLLHYSLAHLHTILSARIIPLASCKTTYQYTLLTQAISKVLALSFYVPTRFIVSFKQPTAFTLASSAPLIIINGAL